MDSKPHSTILALGSNIGDRLDYLNAAKKLLSEIGTIKKQSCIYETEPVGYAGQDSFLNCVIEFETSSSADELLSHTMQIENILGKHKTIANGPRTIDIDIIFFDDEIIDADNLKIPHPRMHERRFVLEPLAEIAPERMHPVLHLSVKDLLEKLKDEHGVRLYDAF